MGEEEGGGGGGGGGGMEGEGTESGRNDKELEDLIGVKMFCITVMYINTLILCIMFFLNTLNTDILRKKLYTIRSDQSVCK